MRRSKCKGRIPLRCTAFIANETIKVAHVTNNKIGTVLDFTVSIVKVDNIIINEMHTIIIEVIIAIKDGRANNTRVIIRTALESHKNIFSII